jgi:hypothetical protein
VFNLYYVNLKIDTLRSMVLHSLGTKGAGLGEGRLHTANRKDLGIPVGSKLSGR